MKTTKQFLPRPLPRPLAQGWKMTWKQNDKEIFCNECWREIFSRRFLSLACATRKIASNPECLSLLKVPFESYFWKVTQSHWTKSTFDAKHDTNSKNRARNRDPDFCFKITGLFIYYFSKNFPCEFTILNRF